MHETEVKLKCDDPESLKKKLESLGAKFREKYSLNDTYFSHGKDMATAKDFVRVRKKNKISEVTYKGKCEDKKGVWTRIELTSKIDEPKAIKQILTLLKLNKIKENKSFREIWDYQNIEIAFIKITFPKDLSFIELEGKNEESIHSLLSELGDSVEIVGKDYFKILD